MEATEKLLVLLVEDDPDLLHVTRLLFEARGHEVMVATRLLEAVKIISENRDRHIAALIDINLSRFVAPDGTVETMKEKSGLMILEFIRDSASHHVVPFVFTGYADEETLLKAYEIGVAGDIIKGIGPRLLVAKVENKFALKAAIHSKIDSMTGLLNFRTFREAVLKDLSALRADDPKRFSLIMFDVDDFKRINDTQGHEVGDRAIEAVGKSIRQGIRDSDLCCRRSGDEFLVWLRGGSLDHSLQDALRIKRIVSLCPIVGREGDIFHASVSFGVATSERGDALGVLMLEKLMAEADAKLAEYKKTMKVGR